jgi:hypothetical protein
MPANRRQPITYKIHCTKELTPVPEFIDPCPKLKTQFSQKQAQNARFHLIENERFGWLS